MEELDQINELAEQVLLDSDVFLVDIELKGSEVNPAIWVYVESEAGNISLERCADVSRELNLLLDASGWHDRKYTLNVSSPGLDRPLKHIRQYVNNVGRKASVIYQKEGEKNRVEGKIVHVEPDGLSIETDKNKKLDLAFSEIEETRILTSFKK